MRIVQKKMTMRVFVILIVLMLLLMSALLYSYYYFQVYVYEHKLKIHNERLSFYDIEQHLAKHQEFIVELEQPAGRSVVDVKAAFRADVRDVDFQDLGEFIPMLAVRIVDMNVFFLINNHP